MLKPHPAAALAPIIIPPNIPKINTCICMTLTTTTSTIASSIPDVNTAQLHALADICCATEIYTKPSVMNSLVSDTKVVTTDSLPTPIVATTISETSTDIPEKTTVDIMEVEKASMEPSEATEEAMDCGTPKHTLSDSSSMNSEPPVVKDENPTAVNGSLEPLEQDKTEKSQLSDDVVMVESINEQDTMQDESLSEEEKSEAINYDDILLLCDLFYLPFEHGKEYLQFIPYKTNYLYFQANKD